MVTGSLVRQIGFRHGVAGILAAGVLTLVLVGSRDFAGGWNDGSRLAAVESLIDHHSLAIDRSIFLRSDASDPRPNPYHPDDRLLTAHGTADKLWIDGHWYSDKSPVPALLMAGCYQVWQTVLGLKAQEQPRPFCWWMTVCSSGLAFAWAVWSIAALGQELRLPSRRRLLLTASFALATVAPVYARHVNNHVLLLGVGAAAMLDLVRLAKEYALGHSSTLRLIRLGCWLGLAYAIDLGAGPVLLLCAVPVVVSRCRRWWPLTAFAVSAFSWVGFHHAVNAWIGGTLGPANAQPEYLNWPGSPFTAHSMTGRWAHDSLLDLVKYSLALLVGKRGFLIHNLPLLLLIPAVVGLRRYKGRYRPELLVALGWCVGNWLLYAVASSNYSGACCSIRWFVPLLAPGFFALALFLKRHPWAESDLTLLSLWGVVLVVIMYPAGPWRARLVPGYWLIAALAIASWLLLAVGRQRQAALSHGRPPLLGNLGKWTVS
ncbi:MAG: hypothetical protein NZ700_08930 [Gemmataceae bacterium]|nr:hypothetical protein [Gemmataceae bacterium]MDW8267397.1 hypothetical protein [Gemmataceae bacterium]